MSKRILLIDSDESFAQSLQQAIGARGFTATIAANSEQGLQLARTEAPDLIVVCVEAQPTNGYMLCTRLKKDDALKGIPVILTSANATADSFEKHKKLKTRAEDYLIKPFQPAELLQKAAALLGVALPPEPPAQQEEAEIVSLEDEPIGLGDLVGEDEPVHLSDSEAAEARSAPGAMQAHADEAMVEVEEVEQVEEPPERSQEDELQMFDAAFDALGPGTTKPPAPQVDDRTAFAGLRLAPAPEAEVAGQPVDEQVEAVPLEAEPEAAPVLEAAPEPVLEAAPAAPGIDPEVHAALEARVHQLEADLVAKEAEVEAAKKSAPTGTSSPADVIKLKEARTKADKEILRLKQDLNEKEKNLNEKESELIELREQQTTLEAQAHTLKDEGLKRDAAAKALQQRAEALAAAAKKFERELSTAREELKAVPALKAKVAEFEAVDKAHQALQKKHAEATSEIDTHKARAAELDGEVEKHKGRASELETELSGARALHETEAEQLKDELTTLKQDLEKLEQQLEDARTDTAKAQAELAASREETEHARTDVTALTGEKDLLSEERDELRRQLEEAQGAAARNEERAVKAYQRVKGDEKLREKTKKALQIALQLLDEVPAPIDDLAAVPDEGADPAAEQQSA